MALDGVLTDLNDPIAHDAKIEFVNREDPRALELIRHDAAHVLAEAVQNLWPGTQVTIGPVIENGFYYDFYRNQPFTPEDLPAIEKKMKELISLDRPFSKEVWSREKTKQTFRDMGENFKVELVDAIPEDQQIKIYRQGEWFDLCRGPHMTSTGKIGNAFKLMKVAGAYWRGDSRNPMLTRIYGTAFAKQAELDDYLHADGRSREARPPQARPRDGPLPLPGGRPRHRVLARRRLDHLPGDRRLHAPPTEGRLSGSQRADDARQVAVGDLGPLGLVPREHVPGDVGRRRHRGRARLRHQADELPGARADLQARAEVVSRPAAAARRVRHRSPLRAVRRAARPIARARLHAGRRPCLLHRRADGRRVPEDQRPDPVDLRRLRLHRRPHGQALDPPRETRRLRRGVGSRREHHDGRARADQSARRQPHQDRDQSGRRRLLRTEVRVRAARRHRPRLAVRHHAGGLQPAGAFRRLLHRARRFQESRR